MLVESVHGSNYRSWDGLILFIEGNGKIIGIYSQRGSLKTNPKRIICEICIN